MSDQKRGVSPKKWGPCTWGFLHFVAMGYPAEPTPGDQIQYRSFFVDALPCVLPCKACRENLKRHITHAPPDAALREGRDALFAWTVRLHNIVNRETGKPAMDPRAAKMVYDAGPRCACKPPGIVAADAVTVLLVLAGAMILSSAFAARR